MAVHALYGEETNHLNLRGFVADYLKLEAGFFGQFIDHPKGPAHYIGEVRKDGVWADNLEIQVVSELYDCRVEIFTTSRTPVKVFNEHPEAIKVPVRLLYLQQSHYELIWDPRRKHPLASQAYGLIEQAGLEAARERDRGRTDDSRVSSDQPTFQSRIYFEKLSNLA
jgi:hypothetical protein